MRAVHVITGLGVGGAEQQLRMVLRHLPVTCDVITLTEPGAVAEGLRADGVRVTDLGMAGNRDVRALPRLARLIKDGGYDLVHTHLYRACLYGRVAARLAGVRAVVATEHSLGERSIEGRALTAGVRGLYLATEKLGSATVAVSGTVARRLRQWGVPAHRLHTVPNGIDAQRFRFRPEARAAVRARLGISDDAFVACGVGRLVPGKQFGALVRAVAGLPGVHLLLAGDGPQRTALRERAAALGASDRVHLLGECGGLPDGFGPAPLGLPDVLAAADVLASPSVEEAFGLAVVEALAAGLPVLYVTCPAVDDLPPGEAPGARRIGAGTAAVAAALREHRDSGAARLPVPPAVDRYSVAGTARQLMDVYRAVTGPLPHPPAVAPVQSPATAPPTTR